jgi:ATP-dependent phosphoenolpyruvate carboxykinase
VGAAAKLARMFVANFEMYADNVSSGIRAAGARVDD